jgi:hypothetical protein
MDRDDLCIVPIVQLIYEDEQNASITIGQQPVWEYEPDDPYPTFEACRCDYLNYVHQAFSPFWDEAQQHEKDHNLDEDDDDDDDDDWYAGEVGLN